MKYLIWLLTFIPAMTYSQSIFTSEMLWSTMDSPGNCCNGDPCSSYYTKISGDSIINGINFKRVVNSIDSLMNSWNTIGFIREDDQKVFFRTKNADTECLLYDFGCSIGDTLNLDCSCGPDSKFKVDSIKSLTVMGKSRKHIYLTYLINGSIDGPVEYWIEGIGSIYGILNGGAGNNCMIGFHERLLCCFKDGIKIYSASGCGDCYYDTPNSSSDYPRKDRSPILFPNPASEYIYIQIEADSHFKEVEVISLEGNILITNRIVDNQEGIDIKNLNGGLYIIRLKGSHGYVYSKFIKQ